MDILTGRFGLNAGPDGRKMPQTYRKGKDLTDERDRIQKLY